MATITLKGNEIHTIGKVLGKGDAAPKFSLTKTDLSEVSLDAFSGKKKILNIFPSLDTPTCSLSVKKFHEKAAGMKQVVLLCISKDLPFAQSRFCAAEGVKNLEMLSAFRSSFAKDYGIEIVDGPLKGLCSRAVIILDENNKVLYSEQVPEIAQEPNYEAALRTLTK